GEPLHEDEEQRAGAGPDAVAAITDGFAEREVFEEREHGEERQGDGKDGGGGVEDQRDDSGNEYSGSRDAFPGHRAGNLSKKNEEGLHRRRRDASEGGTANSFVGTDRPPTKRFAGVVVEVLQSGTERRTAG